MAREPHDEALDDEIDLLRDAQQGLADIEAGRVTPHEEAMARLLDRYRLKDDPRRPCQGTLSLGPPASPPACPEESAERRQ